MPYEPGTYPVTGAIQDGTGGLLPATTGLRTAGVISLSDGRVRRVNAAADGWEDVPGHIVSATAPSTGLFEGLLWWDTTNDELKGYDGSAFNAVGSGGGGGGTGFTLRTGSAAPAGSLGASGDWYLRTSNGQWYEKVNTTWHGRYTPPQLSDVDPLATSTSADAGSGVASSREDHIHVGLALGSQQPEDTGNAADTGARGFASREDHVHAVGFGTGNVESVGTANVAGTNPHPARRDHVHDGGTGGGPDLYDSIPPSIGEDGAIGVSDDASRGDHTHGGQRAVSDNTPEDVGTAAAGTHAAASRSDHVHGGGGGGGAGLSDDNPERIGDALSPGTGTEASRDDHVHRPTFSTTTPSAVAVVGVIGGEEFPARADHAHSGAFLSDADPQDVAEDGESGDNSGAARSDHIHGLPIDNTLQFDGSDQLGVNIGDVVEHLQQNIRYYTSDPLDHSTGGSAAGQVYTTSRYPKNIARIKAEVRPDTPSVYKAGIYTVNSDNDIIAVLGQSADTDELSANTSHTLTFSLLAEADSTLGIPLAGGERIAVLIRRAGDGNNADTRLRRGGEDANSPNTTYPDAENDFVNVNHVVYQHENPAAGNDTESHGTSIRGNIRIFYTVTIDHGSLVGDGNVNAAHIDSESAADGYVLTADGSGGSAWEASTGGGGGGGSGYGDWASIGSVTGAISGNPVTVALNTNETIDDYEELYIHIEANDTNDQRVVSGRFRVADVPTTTQAGGGLGIPFAGNNTDEGAILVRRNADGDSIVLDAFGSVINFPTTAVTSIFARELTAGGGGGGASLSDADPEDVGTTAPGTGAEASRSDHVHAGDIDLADAAPEDVGTAAAGTSEDASRADHIHGGGGAGSLSSADPEDVGAAADDGTGTNASKSDHVHRLPIQDTLQFNNAGAVGVSIADVVEHLQQNIRYYTSNDDYSTDGSAAGHVYATSRFPKNIHRVTAHLTPPSGISDAIYRVGIYTVTSGNQIIAVLGQSADSPEISAEGTYSFDLRAEGEDNELGIPLAGDERIAILVRRVGAGNTADTGLRHGSESANSPNVSYPDAEIDFDDVNHVIYRHENPAAGNDTHSHGTDIRGNLRIFYTVTIDHGSLVGDGNVNAGHIDSESATDGWVLTADGSGGSAWEVASGGGASTFLDLTDTPAAFGTAGQVAAVNAAGDGIVFADAGGGGGGGSTDRIVLADAVGVSNTAGPHEIALTEAMVARQWLTFFVFTTDGASPDGIGYALSDDILALTAEATAPTDAENAWPVVTASYSASNFTQQSGNYFVFRKDDSTLWVRPTRLAAHSLTITATPMGDGGTGAQLSGGLTEQVIVGSRLATTEYGLGTLWTGVVDAISPTISPPIDPDNLLQVAVGLRIDTEAAPELIISGAGIRRMTHTSDPLPSTAVSSDEIPGAYYSARVSRNNEDRVIEINPTLSWMEKRREAGRYGILFAFTENAAGNLSSIRPFVSAAVEIDIEYIVAIVGA